MTCRSILARKSTNVLNQQRAYILDAAEPFCPYQTLATRRLSRGLCRNPARSNYGGFAGIAAYQGNSLETRVRREEEREHLGGVIMMPLAKPSCQRFAALGDAHLIKKEDIRNEGKFDGVDQRIVGKIAGQHSLWTWCAALKGLPGN
ncbi:hypothetical protein IW261DRAFT_1425355 [Armillaria novae-zelandiae]|uniref:Uncharacterized protein n=1 Tax=Armillaria novae-zelandiae TaxID=153914 RepID=A0AA39NTK7_9AGAR|nr:hypothetical protein IW261DRAFT_1425355 [Armillaria novae-zelandiae]